MITSRAQHLLRLLAVITACGMFFVIVTGSRVTNTGSAQGCGAQWPLCRGQFIPEMAAATAIEFTHRVSTAAETLLVLAVAAGTLIFYRRRREAQVLAPLMVFFLFLQAAMGALAVVYPEAPAVLALHFGISLLSFASVVLVAAFLSGLRRERLGAVPRDRPVPVGLRRLTMAALIYTYLVVYSGAYVAHTGANAACLDWPLCHGSLVPAAQGLVGVQVAHRAAAGLLVLVMLAVWGLARRARAARPDLYRGATVALIAVAAQALSGGAVVLGRFELLLLLSHAALVSLLFAALCYMVYAFVPRRLCLPRSGRESSSAAHPEAIGAGAR